VHPEFCKLGKQFRTKIRQVSVNAMACVSAAAPEQASWQRGNY
jgi:hypothetical protein